MIVCGNFLSQRRETPNPGTKADDTFGRGGVIDDVLLTARDEADDVPPLDSRGGWQRHGSGVK